MPQSTETMTYQWYQKSFSQLANLLTSQTSFFTEMYLTPQYRSPMLVIWVGSFGGALHAPVTSFFYLAVGASEHDIGVIGALQSLSSLLLSPVYGHVADNYGYYHVYGLSTTLCSVGCLVRGLAGDVKGLYTGAIILGLGGAQAWSLALGYLSTHTPPNRKSEVVSGFIVQVQLLGLLGKMMFTPLDWSLRGFGGDRSDDADGGDLWRWRIEMGICTVFCFYGLIALVGSGGAMQEADRIMIRNKQISRKASSVTTANNDLERGVHESPSLASITRAESLKNGNRSAFSLSMAVLLCQSTATTIVTVLWPLYIRDAYQWSATEYGYLVLMSSMASIVSVASYPKLEARYGIAKCGEAACVCGMVCSLGFFIDSRPLLNPWYKTHVVLAVGFISSLAFLEPCIRTLSSNYSHSSVQGRSFGFMNAIAGVGSILGNLAGTKLYQIGKGYESVTSALYNLFFEHHEYDDDAPTSRDQDSGMNGKSLPFLFAFGMIGIAAVI